ncbi:peptidylprolyl isomerase [Flavobacterium subsaxonicum]|nr:peptidylprolyl isomerase [Flavobacterium subsaxonicum]
MKHLLLFLLLPLCNYAQTNLMSKEEANKYLYDKSTKVAITHICEKQPYYPIVSPYKEGEFIEKDGRILQVTKIAKDETFCVAYIFLDGSKLSEKEIADVREEILKKHKEGAAFKDLIKQYNTDGNPNSEYFSFSEKGIVPQFTAAVKSHNPGDVFTIDVPQKKWYYVVMRHADNLLPVYVTRSAALPKK